MLKSNQFLAIFLVFGAQFQVHANEDQKRADLVNPDVDAVKLTDHFKQKKYGNLREDQNNIFLKDLLKDVVIEGLVLGYVGSEVIISKSKKADEDKIIRKLIKKGFRVAAKGARVYLISDAATKVVLRFNEIDPGLTAIPGAVGWAAREVHELALESPERIKRIPSQAHDAAKTLIKQSTGKINEE